MIKYTCYGDADLDGQVDGSDYSRIDSGALTLATGWLNGDFNYDGTVDGSDYTLIDNAYNTQAASLAAPVAARPGPARYSHQPVAPERPSGISLSPLLPASGSGTNPMANTIFSSTSISPPINAVSLLSEISSDSQPFTSKKNLDNILINSI